MNLLKDWFISLNWKMVLDSKKFSINIFRKYTTLYNHNKNFRKALNNPNLIFHYRGLAIQTK